MQKQHVPKVVKQHNLAFDVKVSWRTELAGKQVGAAGAHTAFSTWKSALWMVVRQLLCSSSLSSYLLVQPISQSGSTKTKRLLQMFWEYL